MDHQLSWFYFPTALVLGALHALEPGHAKTLTAAYLVGIRGTKKDALFLGLSVALTHSFVVISISLLALYLGKESFTEQATKSLQIGSALVVIFLGAWMLFKRIKQRKPPHSHHNHTHDHDHPHQHDDHDSCDHHHEIPDYAKSGQRPTGWQLFTFGAAGGMIPCPASITVMLLALSVGQVGFGLLTVMGFSLGLAIALVSVGLLVVAGMSQFEKNRRFHWISKNSPVISAGVVMLSGFLALIFH